MALFASKDAGGAFSRYGEVRVEELGFEDREIVLQVLAAVWPVMTERQRECLMLCCFAGLTQEGAGEVLQVGQRTVSQHFEAALEKVKEIAPEYL